MDTVPKPTQVGGVVNTWAMFWSLTKESYETAEQQIFAQRLERMKK